LEIMREEDWESGPVHHSVAAYGTVQRVKVQMTRAYWQAGCHRYIAPILINLYGPGDHFHPDKSHGMAALIRRFLDATEDGSGEVVLWGTGNAVREWTYVDDAVEGLMRLAEVYRSPDPVNLATGEGVSVGDLAREIASVVHFTGRIRFDPSKPEGVLRKIASVERLETHLGWKPSTSRLEGIERTVKHLVDHYEEAVA
ncbi:MAG: NAD-dependent epimerase/dehydratase family protein, partial [Euryarchaeota archaeon]|nr:NAD-dependent epimerase/dehydratase family protein [Euryarchaeota archaeon]